MYCWVYGRHTILYHIHSYDICSLMGQPTNDRLKRGVALQAFKDPAFPHGRLVELLKLVAAKGGAAELADVLQLVTKGEAHGR